VYNISEKLELAHAHYEASITFKASTYTNSANYILLQGLKRCTRLHPSYLLATIAAILPIKLVSATFLLKISFVIIVEKRDIRNLSVLPSSQSGSNSDYNGKICQHLPLYLTQKPRHLSLPLRLCPPKVIPTRMLRKGAQC
jgi:hypothetical protein